jgi:hypothetical protein
MFGGIAELEILLVRKDSHTITDFPKVGTWIHLDASSKFSFWNMTRAVCSWIDGDSDGVWL